MMRARLLPAFLLFLGVLLVYRPALSCDFINFDDPIYIHANPILHGSPLDAFTTIHAGYWIPMTWLSYQVDHALSGLSPGGYHRTNVLLHGATAALLFLVLCRLTNATGRSFVVAALFAFHPIQVESVAWITERKDVLSTFFLVLALWAYASYAARVAFRSAKGRPFAERKATLERYLLVTLLFALGLMAKPMLVTLPLALLLLDFWPLERWRVTSWRWLLLEKVPWLLLAFAAGVLTILTQKHGTAVRSFDEFSLYPRLSNVLVGYVVYLKMLVWPFPLAVFYPHPGNTLSPWQVGGAALLLLALTGLAWSRRHTSPYLLMGWLWYLVTLGPVSGVLQAGWQAQADRFLYVPAIGLFLAVVWAAARYWRLAPVVLVGCIVATVFQQRHWRDSLTVWEHVLSTTRESFLTHNSLAAALLDRGRTEEAIGHLRRSQELKPDERLTAFLLGTAYRQQRQLAEAEAAFRRALTLPPDNVEVHAALAEVLVEQGDLDDAERHAQHAFSLAPRSAEAWQSLAVVRLQQGHLDEALQYLRAAVRYDPHSRTARQLLIEQLRQRGSIEEAEEQERQMRRYYPGWKRGD